MIYVAHRDANAVSVIDGKTNKVVAKMSDKDGPVGIAVNPNTNIVYVANYLSDTVSAIDGKTNKVVANPGNSSNSGVQDVVVDPHTNFVYMAKDDVYTVSVINGIRNFDRLDSSGIYRTISNVTVGSGPFNTWPRDLAFSLAINPNTDVVYAANWVNGIIGAIDGETNTLIANITDVSVPERMAINTNTNMLYALNPISGIVYVIDGLTNKLVSKIRVGDFPTDVAVNPATNTVYVSNRDSNTISVIDGKTNRLVTGITFSTSPPNAGIIYCNNQKVAGNYSRYDVGTPIECEARPNPGFAFSSWSGDLASGGTSNPLRFSVSQFGERLNSNFIVPVEVAIPKEFFNRLSILVISVILPFIITWSIPSIVGWLKSNRQRKHLQKYLTKIDIKYATSNNQNKDNIVKSMNSIMKEIENMYAEGKLKDSQYGFLKDKISDYIEQINDPK
jgi:YVTN family beta-propeller protein